MARRFARRRKPRVAWLPVFGGSRIDAGEDAAPFPGIEASLSFPAGPPTKEVIWDAFPLTFDETESAAQTQADPTKVTLRDIVQGNEWKLRRIVGKAFISVGLTTPNDGFRPLYQVGLGFIVCKTYDDGAPLTDFNDVNPLSQESMEDPWIWRRTWLLSDANAATYGTFNNLNIASTAIIPNTWRFPVNTALYGSVADGPHIDAKSQRRIHRSERLFGVLAMRRYWGTIDVSEVELVPDATCQLLLDYRLVGSLGAQSYGNRGNTSR